ncbi:MAG: Flagellar motor switch protein FliN [uncultured Sphingomonadaceae bacterium]|uniref:Flagellar motor switch protein FliN n=1 Tax=uncultured Sphingomonadaceae bacterium TaxID=169976 RepID=A0A6J4T6R2_9SPHN|nr:MAG: Flagellar motor switch protein FliN [uncultured Sphingomonadaceae bacterium]
MMEDAMNQDFPMTSVEQTAPAFIEDFGSPDFDPAPAEPARRADDRLDAVHDVPVKVQAVLGRSRMPIGDLLRLKAGMVVELDRRVGEPVDIFVNNRLIARGEVVMIDQSLGVTLTEIIRQDR